jgi:AGZA family xanthine/uracil permease-like MFS transporter
MMMILHYCIVIFYNNFYLANNSMITREHPMHNIFDRFFKLSERGTTTGTESVAGVTTFLTMAYIIFVQPAVLSAAGMNFGAVMTATCLSAAIASLLMGLIANYPIALASAMGENFFFVFTVVLAMNFSWQAALAVVFVEGILFLFITLVGFREAILDAIPYSLKTGMAIGIGLLIAFIGLKWSGIVVNNLSTGISIGNLRSAPVLTAVTGVFITVAFIARNIKGAVLWGILSTAVIGLCCGIVTFQGITALPPSIAPVLAKFDFSQILSGNFITAVVILLYMEIFDTIGTIIGVGETGGFLKNGRLPGANKVLFVDALGTSIGALCGTSTVSAYIESNTGVQAGGRTGLASVVTAGCFLAAMFFSPLVQMIGGGYKIAEGVFLYPIAAPALITVGFFMLKSVQKLDFSDLSETLPAYLIIIGIPLTYSIADGIALGMVSYPIVKLFSGKIREVSPLMFVLAGLFILKYTLLG